MAAEDTRKSELVELRFFGGLAAEETAEALGMSVRTVHRGWDLVRAWLFRELLWAGAASCSLGADWRQTLH